MKDTLYINGQLADMKADSGVYLNYASNMFNDITKIVGNYSNTITLPKTARNVALIDGCVHVGVSSSYPYAKQRADLFRDGVPVVIGADLHLLKVTEKEINISLSWGVSSALREALTGDAKLADCYDANEVVFWYKDTDDTDREHGGTADFPLAEYGFPYSDISRQYFPVQSVASCLYHIYTKYGLTFKYSRKVWESGAWAIPLTSARDSIHDEVKVKVYDGTQGTQGESVASFFTQNYGTTDLERLRLTKTGISLYTRKTNNGDATTDDDKTWYKTSITTLCESERAYVSGTLQARVVSPTEIDALGLKASFCVDQPDGAGGTERKDILTINADHITARTHYTDGAGEWRYDVRFVFDNEECDIIERTSSIYLRFYNDNGNEVKNGHTMQGEFTIYAKREPIVPNMQYNIKENIPDISVKDFLKAVMSMSGMYATLDADGSIMFSDFDTLIANKTSAQDWSNYLLFTRDWSPACMEFKQGSEAKKNTLKYKGNYEAFNDYYTISNDALDAERVAVELPFESYDTINGRMRVNCYEYKDGKLEYNENLKARIAKVVAFRNAVTNRMSYELRPLYWNELKQYYANYISVLNGAKVLTENFVLTPDVLCNLNITRPVYLKQYGAHFAIIEIKTKANNIAEVKLIKI